MRSEHGTQGFTLVEVLAALLVLGMVMATMFAALLANTSLNSKVERKAEAVRISEQKLENYRQLGRYGNLVTQGTVAETVTYNGKPYTVQTTFCPSDRPSTMVCSNTAVYIRLDVLQTGQLLHRAETFYTSFGKEDE
ncbi:type II secretion system protein [Deinococcus aerophilus]|uniref:Type II secretion system protein n=1 Tax=Deinococcus aerophilus TaxID=522488 RepID=A0ABQ2GY17_9DEIO|nr:type II secretion system protein [Deinococcus aerophilus]GGM16948.1 hypothetical protein GCM10010841_26540 [Deinococcus aerophilus]